MHYALRHVGIPADKLKHLHFFLRREMAVKMQEDIKVVADPHGALLDGLVLGFGGPPQVCCVHMYPLTAPPRLLMPWI